MSTLPPAGAAPTKWAIAGGVATHRPDHPASSPSPVPCQPLASLPVAIATVSSCVVALGRRGQQRVPPRLQVIGALRRHRAALGVLPPLAHERVVVDHLVARREHQAVLRRAAARAAHDVRVHLLIARAPPLRPAVRPPARARRVRRPPERAAVAKLGVGAAAEVILAAQPLVNRPLCRPFRRAALAIGEADVEVAARRRVVQSVDQVVRLQRRRLQQRVEVGAHRHVAVDHRHVEPGLLDDARHVVVARVPQPAHLHLVLAAAKVPRAPGARDHPRRPHQRAAVLVRHHDDQKVLDPDGAKREDEIGDPRGPRLVAVRQDELAFPRARRRRLRELARRLEVAAAVGRQLAERRVRRRRRLAQRRPHPERRQLRRQRVPRRAFRRRRHQVVVAARRQRRRRRPPRRRRRRGRRAAAARYAGLRATVARVPVGVAQRGADRAAHRVPHVGPPPQVLGAGERSSSPASTTRNPGSGGGGGIGHACSSSAGTRRGAADDVRTGRRGAAATAAAAKAPRG